MSGKPPIYTPIAQTLLRRFPTGNTPPKTPGPKPKNIDLFLQMLVEEPAPAMSGTTAQPVETEVKGKNPEPKKPSRPGSPK